MIYIMIKYKMQGQSCSLKHYDIFDSQRANLYTVPAQKTSTSSSISESVYIEIFYYFLDKS